MPITKSAIKKLRQDKKRTIVNRAVKDGYKVLVKKFRKQPKSEQLAGVYEALDRAAKKHVIHPNRAARLKSRLSKLVRTGTETKSASPAAKSKKPAKPAKAPKKAAKK